jgi:quinol monooxygenase YgiN
MLCFEKGLGAVLMVLVLLIGSDAASAQQQKMIVRISEIEIEPSSLDEYKAVLKEESAASVRLEPGVVSIFPMYQKENPTQVRILEIYASREAYETHLKTPHFQQYKTTTLKMVKSLKLVDMEMLDPETMIRLASRTLPSVTKLLSSMILSRMEFLVGTTTPRLKMSVRLSRSRPRACSGDMQLIVPMTVPGFVLMFSTVGAEVSTSASLSIINFARPKSSSLMIPSRRIITFSV